MNLVIAVFLYLGLTYPGDTITGREIDDHSVDIESTKTDPAFIQFYSTLGELDGVVIIDHDAME